MFPYSYFPQDDYEQYIRALRQRQAYEYQQRQAYEYMRQQEEYMRQQEELQRYCAFQLREREQERRRQEAARARMEQQREQERARERRRAQKQHEQELRKQFLSRHQDGPITMSLFDVLDYIQGGHGETQEPEPQQSRPEPQVDEPPSPRIELVEDLMRGLGIEPRRGPQRAVPQPPQFASGAEPRPEPRPERPQRPSSTQETENTDLLRTLKPRIGVEKERYEAIRAKAVVDAASAKLKLRNLKEARARVEAVYQQLDSLRVGRPQRNLKHDLTSAAVRLADAIDDSIAEVRPQLAQYQASEPPSPALSAGEAPASPSLKHHVTLEDVEDESD